jgi:hypothetical protein
MPAAQYAQRQDAVERVLEMQSQAAVAAAAGLAVDREFFILGVWPWFKIANDLQSAKRAPTESLGFKGIQSTSWGANKV